MGVAPPARIGVRMALERRRGRAAVPVWSSLAGAGVAVLGLVAVAVFGASLQHLQSTPSAYGRPWDVRVDDTRAQAVHAGDQCGPKRTRLTSDADVAAVANACSTSIEINGRGTGAVSLTPLAGRTEPTVLAGRAPQGAGEIALGRETLAALHRRIGDHVTGRTRAGAVRYRVVGEVAVPELSDPQAVADGAVLTGEGLHRLIDENNGSASWYLVARFRPGIDQAAAVARIHALPGVGGFEQPGVVGVGVPLEVERLDQIHRMPLFIGGFLAIVGAIAVGHLLVTSVRRRRRDFAVLKSVGFTRRQVLATVSCQATTVAVVGLLVGAVLGLVVGDVLWEAIARQVGVLPDAMIPTAILAGIAVATVIVVNVIAAFPARSAARTRPAVTLRSE
jgi:putative ABC transport system permease protein